MTEIVTFEVKNQNGAQWRENVRRKSSSIFPEFDQYLISLGFDRSTCKAEELAKARVSWTNTQEPDDGPLDFVGLVPNQ